MPDDPHAFLLPAFASGELILASDLNAADRALVYLESYFGLPVKSRRFAEGQIVTAADFNALYHRACRVIEAAGGAASLRHTAMASDWNCFPVDAGDVMRAEVINELFGKINAVLRWADLSRREAMKGSSFNI
jgi:hypothetical protein